MADLLPTPKPTSSGFLPSGLSSSSLLPSGLKRRSFRIFRVLFFLGLFLIVCVLSINVYVYSETKQYIFPAPIFPASTYFAATSTIVSTYLNGEDSVSSAEINADAKIPRATVAILLGASVYRNGELTPILADRADTAVDLYKSGHVSMILVTGDNSTKYYNEITPTRNYLLKRDVAPEDIIVDNFGLDTFQSMYRAKNVFNVESALVVSQRFHLARAVYIARHLGIDAYGITADHRSYNIRNDLREIFATVKSVWKVGVR